METFAELSVTTENISSRDRRSTTEPPNQPTQLVVVVVVVYKYVRSSNVGVE